MRKFNENKLLSLTNMKQPTSNTNIHVKCRNRQQSQSIKSKGP